MTLPVATSLIRDSRHAAGKNTSIDCGVLVQLGCGAPPPPPPLRLDDTLPRVPIYKSSKKCDALQKYRDIYSVILGECSVNVLRNPAYRCVLNGQPCPKLRNPIIHNMESRNELTTRVGLVGLGATGQKIAGNSL